MLFFFYFLETALVDVALFVKDDGSQGVTLIVGAGGAAKCLPRLSDASPWEGPGSATARAKDVEAVLVGHCYDSPVESSRAPLP